MKQFEKLGVFYLGKTVDQQTGKPGSDYLLYDSKDLVTHAVCVGMTGSGKTGLCIGLLEEAAIDNIPAIIIDPKGDLGNLLLTFPELRGKDFQPWINPDEANQKGVSPETYADQQAELWKNGLASWDQDGERIQMLRDAADFAIYTPGSSAGLPVSILKSFSAPAPAVLNDYDLLRERIQSTVSGILQLLGINADPLQSREHILLSNIIEETWRGGKDLDLGGLIQMIQTPPMQKIGVFDIEAFYPSSDRFKLAMTMNNLLAAPGFKSWLEGDPLDIDAMMYTAEGKPRVTIFSIAHLSDAERMFFVTLLLGQMLSWMRAQSGTTSLRALLYMDEVFGFLPPIGEPPSKKPLLTLLKQARAFGLGVVLATQNPVDLDYKGLSNTGTWFIGRLQTERDQDRLIDGLTSASGDGLNKSDIKSLISGLQKRSFLLHNVHEKHPVVFSTRWVMSYLRGPLTRNQIKVLMDERRRNTVAKSEPATATSTAASQPITAASTTTAQIRPQLPPEIRQYFAPQKLVLPKGARVIYHPHIVAGGAVQIVNSRYNIAESQTIGHLLPLPEDAIGLRWDDSKPASPDSDLLGGAPIDSASYLPVPAEINRVTGYSRLDKDYESFVYRDFSFSLLQSKEYKQISRPGESERDFRIRLTQIMHERRDLEIDRLRRRYASKIDSLEKQIRTAERQLDKEATDLQQQKMNTALSIGSTVLGMLFGSRSSTRIATAAKTASRISKERRDFDRTEDKLTDLQDKLRDLESELQNEIDQLTLRFDPASEPLETVDIRPKKSDVLQRYFGLLWLPFAHLPTGEIQALYE